MRCASIQKIAFSERTYQRNKKKITIRVKDKNICPIYYLVLTKRQSKQMSTVEPFLCRLFSIIFGVFLFSSFSIADSVRWWHIE